MALTDKLTAIGNAIREKEGSTDLIALGDMPERILALSSGGGEDEYKQQTINFMNNSSAFTFTVPAGVTKLRASAFKDCSWLRTLKFEDASQITELGANSFENCKKLLSMPHLPNIKKIDYYTFSGCSLLTSYEIPPKVTTLDYYCFKDSGLTSITIPATVKTINNQAFAMCYNLKKVRFLGEPTTTASNIFNYSGVTDIYVPWASNYTTTVTSAAPWGATNATIHYDTSPDEVIE